MSDEFAESNTERTDILFNKRLRYKQLVFGEGQNNIVSFLDGEKIFYGRIDRKFVPIETGGYVLKPINNTSDPTSGIVAINFVADMFNDMINQFKKQNMRGKISLDNEFLSNLKAYKAYVDPRKEYNNYKSIYLDTLKNLFYSKQAQKFENFNQFVNTLVKFLSVSIDKQPFTYTGFLKSKHCTVMSSGLAIEIADAEYQDDLRKYDDFVQSKNWPTFVNTCNIYGFMIDYNVPWRIVADIGALECLQRSILYGGGTVEKITHKFFKPASQHSYEIFKKTMLEAYNYIKPEYYDEISVCQDGSIMKKRKSPMKYDADRFYRDFNDNYFLSLYLKMRIKEEQPNLDPQEADRLIKEAIATVNKTGKKEVIHKKFESIINKTFDKRGSLSYSVNSNRLRTLDDFESGLIDNLTVSGDSNDFSSY